MSYVEITFLSRVTLVFRTFELYGLDYNPRFEESLSSRLNEDVFLWFPSHVGLNENLTFRTTNERVVTIENSSNGEYKT